MNPRHASGQIPKFTLPLAISFLLMRIFYIYVRRSIQEVGRYQHRLYQSQYMYDLLVCLSHILHRPPSLFIASTKSKIDLQCTLFQLL